MSRARVEKAIRVIGRSSGLPVAPHVAARIAELGDLDDVDLAEIAVLLSPGQLSGLAVLPDPLPLPPRAKQAAELRLAGLGAAARRLLLVSALSTSERIDVLMSATAVDVAVALDPEVSQRIVFHDGRFRLASPLARTEIIGSEPKAAIADAHRALARASQHHGLRGEAAWHAHHGAVTARPAPPADLLLLGRRLLRDGSAAGAHAVGRAVSTSADPAMQAQGRLLSGQAALAMGCFDDATTALNAASSSAALQETARTALRAAEGLLAGPAPSSDAMLRVSEQARHLHGAAATAPDRAALQLLDEISEVWWTDVAQVDALHARLFLSTSRAHPAWPWANGRTTLSPLVEAHVRGQHLGFHLIMGDLPEAASILEDAVLRLPMTHIGGGVTGSALGGLESTSPGLAAAFAESFERIRPARVVVYRPEPMPLSTIPAVSRRFRNPVGGDPRPLLDKLTPREQQVADLASRSLSNAEIGARLLISERTVEVHLTSVFRKLGTRSRVELAVLLVRGGPATPPMP